MNRMNNGMPLNTFCGGSAAMGYNGAYAAMPVGAPIYKHTRSNSLIGVSCPTVPQTTWNERFLQRQPGVFINVKDVKAHHEATSGDVLASKYIGKLRKLSTSGWWQRRYFTIDGLHFVCFGTKIFSENHHQNSLQIDSLLPGKCGSFYHVPKWVIPISNIIGVYVLEGGMMHGMSGFCSRHPTKSDLWSMASTADAFCAPLGGLSWRNVLLYPGGFNPSQLHAAALSSVKHCFMIKVGSRPYIMRASSGEELAAWLNIIVNRLMTMRQTGAGMGMGMGLAPFGPSIVY